MRLDDPRNKLVHVFMDAVDSLRPRSFLMENVDNLGTKPLFKPILDKLTERAKSLGYACQRRVLDTHNFDVPQRAAQKLFSGKVLRFVCTLRYDLLKNRVSSQREL